MIEFDHVIVAVRDLEAAAARFLGAHGLASLPGGRHVGLGTQNRIVPLDPDYIELLAVSDPGEVSRNPWGSWVARQTAEGDRLAALCLRTDDIDSVARRLGTEPVAMGRERPDGTSLKWRLAGLAETLADPSLPFFIQWEVGPDEVPGRGRAPHRVEPRGISYVEIGNDEANLWERMGDADLDVRVVEGQGLKSVGVETIEGTIVLK